ncbi:MAG: hypothetical protein KA715_13250 [Xanthomonadaceae bacterium]|nr:hypothetical protein [Xanthomonadaceae bacterium]
MSLKCHSILLLLLVTHQSQAMTFTINNASSPLTNAGNDLVVKTAVFSMATQLQNQVNNSVLIPESSFQTTLTAFSNASVASSNGLGVMYEGGVKKVSLGIGVGGGASGSFNSFSRLGAIQANQLPDVGGGAQVSAILGLSAAGMGWKIGRLDPKRLNVFFNAMYLYHPNLYNVALRIANLGAHVQYHIHAPARENLLFHWDGISFTTGLRYMYQDAAYSTAMTISQSDAASQSTMSWRANYNLGVHSNVFTVPIEVTSNFDFLETFGFVLGAGADLSLGGAATYGGASGPIQSNSTLPGLTSSTIYTGTGVLDAGSNTYAPSLGVMKALVGVHFKLWAVRFSVQGMANTASAYSAYSGLHLVI